MWLCMSPTVFGSFAPSSVSPLLSSPRSFPSLNSNFWAQFQEILLYIINIFIIFLYKISAHLMATTRSPPFSAAAIATLRSWARDKRSKTNIFFCLNWTKHLYPNLTKYVWLSLTKKFCLNLTKYFCVNPPLSSWPHCGLVRILKIRQSWRIQGGRGCRGRWRCQGGWFGSSPPGSSLATRVSLPQNQAKAL